MSKYPMVCYTPPEFVGDKVYRVQRFLEELSDMVGLYQGTRLDNTTAKKIEMVIKDFEKLAINDHILIDTSIKHTITNGHLDIYFVDNKTLEQLDFKQLTKRALDRQP